MDKKRIYADIKQIADKLVKDGDKFSRADLAYELKMWGIDRDSEEVSKLVWEAYRYYNQDKNIDIAYTSNGGKQTVVEEYRTKALFDEGQLDKAFKSTKVNAKKTESELADLAVLSKEAVNTDLVQSAGSLVNTLSGSNGIANIKDKAALLLDRYTALIDAYNDAQYDVKISINDFVTLRNSINELYRKYASTLTNVFGDRIKQVAPDLFDFEKISYLDTKSMQKNIELSFNKIDDQCALLIGEVKDSFKKSLQKSLSDFRSAGKTNKEIGLIMAGIDMLNHYIDAEEKTLRMQNELTALKGYINHDVNQINVDRNRLFTIYRTMNDVYVPKALAFFKHADRLMDNELKFILDAIYSAPDAKRLRTERDNIIVQIKELESSITDHLRNVDLYEWMIKEESNELDIKLPVYLDAKQRKPAKPNTMKNVVTFGKAKKTYNRAVFEWEKACAPLVTSYEDMKVRLDMNTVELDKHKQALKECQAKHRELKTKLNIINYELLDRVGSSADAKTALSSHLKPLIGLLRLGKDIMESKLDKNLMRVANITDFNALTELPDFISENIDQLVANIKEAATAKAEQGNSDSVEITERPFENGTIPERPTDIDAQERLAQQLLDGGVSVMNAWLKIGKEELRQRKAANGYDAELKSLQLLFKKYMDQIDNKSAYLNEVLKHINTSKNSEELRDAVLELGEWDANSISEKDWEDFLNGDKALEI